MDKIKSKSGITLAALVVTIIIMIILAGVTLRLTIGDEGVISQSMNAKEEQAKSVYKELITVEVAAEKIAGTDTDTADYLQNIQKRLEGKEEFEGANYEVKNGSTLVITTKEGYQYAVVGDKVILADNGNGSGTGGGNGTGGGDSSTEIPVIKEEEIKFKTIPSYWVNTGVTVEITSPKHPTLSVEYTDDESKLSEPEWTKYQGKFSVDTNREIYARLRSEAGPSEIYGTSNIGNIDKVAPLLTAQSFKVSESSTRGFKVELEVQDIDSGLAQITWSYKLKDDTKWNKGVTDLYHTMHTNDKGSNKVEVKSHSFDRLSSGEYEVQANIYDVAGNITSAGPINVTIGKIEDLVKSEVVGSYSFNPSGWTNGTVTVTLPTIPNFETRYTTDGSLPNTSSSKYEVGSPIVVTQNCRLYYIYTDGVNVTKYATKEIGNIDKDKIAIKTALAEDATQKTTKSFGVSIQFEDEPKVLAYRSGLAYIDWFYRLSGSGAPYESLQTFEKAIGSDKSGATGVTTRSQVISNLKNGTYEVYVDIYDVAGNVTSTKATPLTVELGTMALPNADRLSYDPTYLTDGDVTVTLPVPTGDFGIKYSIDGTVPTLENFASLQDYFDPFTVSSNCSVYFIYTDGTNISNVAARNIGNIDKTPANITSFTTEALSTNSFKLKATFQDSDSGIGKVVFGYKAQGATSYTEKIWTAPSGVSLKPWKTTSKGPTGVVTAEETFTGMATGKYDCYVKVFNSATSADEKASKATGEVTLEGLGTVSESSYSPTTWTNGNVTVTLPTAPNGLYVVYTVDGSRPTVSSARYTEPVVLTANGTVNYAYTDGTNITDPGGRNVTNIDKSGAEAGSITQGTTATKSMQVKLNVKDNVAGSGIDRIVWYIKKGNTWSSETYTAIKGTNGVGEAVGTSWVEKTHTFSGLTQNTEYSFYAVIYDVAGNETKVGSETVPSGKFKTSIQAVEGLSISPTTIADQNINATFTITPTVTPSDANDKTVSWSSSNTTVATVSPASTQSGTATTVTCKAAGTVTITASCGGKTQTLSLKVKNPINSMTLSKTETTILYGGYTTTVEATTDPADYSASNISWTIADTTLATVSVSGKTATITSNNTKKTGTTKLTVTAGSITKEVAITVTSFTTTTYSYTGKMQAVDLPAGKYKLEVWGAQGGTYNSTLSGGGTGQGVGGKGGYSCGVINLTTATRVYVNVGEAGHGKYSSDYAGGWNGGASGDGASGGDTDWGAGGGGATDISLLGVANSSSWNTSDHLYSRIIVAGGGGGQGDCQGKGGYGGGLTGEGSYEDYYGNETSSNGGTQTSGYAFGYGGTGTSNDNDAGSGGGWYGGKGGTAAGGNSGAGGSGYVYTSSTYSNYPSGCKLNSS